MAKATPHQWKNRYSTPLSQGQVISGARPGAQIARSITEIQNVIDNITGADGKEEELNTLPDAEGVTDDKVLQAQSGVAVWDYVRAIG